MTDEVQSTLFRQFIFFYHLPWQALFYLPLNSFGNSWWKWKIISAFLSFPGIVFVQSFFMKNTWYVNWGADPEITSNTFNWSALKMVYGFKYVWTSVINLVLVKLTISCRSGFLDPISEMPHKIEEKISLWHWNYFICDFDEKAEPFCWPEI